MAKRRNYNGERRKQTSLTSLTSGYIRDIIAEIKDGSVSIADLKAFLSGTAIGLLMLCGAFGMIIMLLIVIPVRTFLQIQNESPDWLTFISAIFPCYALAMVLITCGSYFSLVVNQKSTTDKHTLADHRFLWIALRRSPAFSIPLTIAIDLLLTTI